MRKVFNEWEDLLCSFAFVIARLADDCKISKFVGGYFSMYNGDLNDSNEGV